MLLKDKIEFLELVTKVLIYKSCSELSLLVQLTIQCVSILPPKSAFKIKTLESFFTLMILEIKPCGLGSRIRDVEADLIY